MAGMGVPRLAMIGEDELKNTEQRNGTNGHKLLSD